MDKEIKSLWCALDEDVDRLCGLWKLYKQLFGSTENVELLFQSGRYVFFQLRRLITDHVFLILIKLSDPAEMGKEPNG